LLIRWTQHGEHDNFAPSIAGTPPGLNIDLTLTAATEDTLRRQVKNHSRSIMWKTRRS